MYTQISSKKRLTALLVAFAFLLGTFVVGTETVSAASKLKVSPTRKTVYIGSKVTIKANKKVKWSVSGKKEDRKDRFEEIQEEQEGHRQSVQGRNGLCKSKIRKEDKENPHHRSQQGSHKDQCGQHGDRNRCGQSLHR